MASTYYVTFTTVTTITPASGGGTGGVSGGGGGGGGSAGDAVSEDNPLEIIELDAGDWATFIFEEEAHTLTIECNEGGVVTILIESKPMKVILKTNKPAYVDVNNDGVNDVVVTLLKVLSPSKVKVEVKYIGKASKATAAAIKNPKITKGTPRPAPEDLVAKEKIEEAQESKAINSKKEKATSQRSLILLAVVAIIVIAGGYWLVQKRHTRPS